MYIPKHFEEHDTGVLHALIEAHPFGAWVTQAEGSLRVNHLPFLIDRTRGEFGTLLGHVARANPVWREFSRDAESVVIFQGPNGYVTPSWYPSKRAHGKVVPTWNYAVVHVHGMPRIVEDRDRLLALVTALTNRHESVRADPWQVSDAPPDFVDSMLKAIVGIEMPVAKLVGKWKTSQNRPMEDRHGVIAGLQQRADPDAREMAEMIRRHAGAADD